MRNNFPCIKTLLSIKSFDGLKLFSKEKKKITVAGKEKLNENKFSTVISEVSCCGGHQVHNSFSPLQVMTANSNVLRLPVLQVMTGLTCVTFITETNRPVLPSYFIKTYSILFIIQEFYINDIKVILNEILKARYHSAHFRSSIIFRKGDTICNLEHIFNIWI